MTPWTIALGQLVTMHNERDHQAEMREYFRIKGAEFRQRRLTGVGRSAARRKEDDKQRERDLKAGKL